MTWRPIGYIAKRRATRLGWASVRAALWPESPGAGFPAPSLVEEICSVSGCIARRIDGAEVPASDPHFELYPDAERAWAIVPASARADFALYAYRLWPMQFDDGQEQVIDLWWEPAVEQMADTFIHLGWDAVVGGNGHGFGCSPISCNSGADIVRCPQLNRYGLVSDEQAAIALACSFSITKPEPGPYCVVEVWRDTATLAELGAAANGGA